MASKCQCCDLFPASEHYIVGHEYCSLCARCLGVVEGRRKIVSVLELAGKYFYMACASGFADGIENSAVAGKRTAPDHRDSLQVWQRIHEQFEPLAAEHRIAGPQAGEVYARMCQALDDAECDRIGDKSKDNRCRYARLPEREDGGFSQGDDYVWTLRCKLCDEC